MIQTDLQFYWLEFSQKTTRKGWIQKHADIYAAYLYQKFFMEST
jgi:hypothetical protein